MSSKEESEIKNSESKESNKSNKCDPRCAHQANRICYNDEGSKEVIKKFPQDAPQSETADDTEVDSLHSGESLFKTFNFETQEEDPDMEKCMAFWQTALAKNVKPIKCTLLKPEKPKKKKPVNEQKPAQKDICEEEETRKMWLNIYKDLQRRKLDKLRLVKKQVCDPCGDYIDEEMEKKQDTQEIKQLNNWKSSKTSGRKNDIASQMSRTQKSLKDARGAKESRPSVSQKSSSNEEIPQKTLQVLKAPPESQKTQPKINPPSDPPVKLSTLKTELEIQQAPKNSPQISVMSEESSKMESAYESPISQSVKSESKVLEDTNLIEEKMSCCECACLIEECVCAQMSEIIETYQNKDKKNICEPCECGSCVCEELQEEICQCGCQLECICENLEKKPKGCSCGCGMEDCICDQLFTKSCKCGNDDCDCDMIEILTTYLETLDTPKGVAATLQEDDIKLISTECQTDEKEKWLLETTQKQGSYCIICGHFNCYCRNV